MRTYKTIDTKKNLCDSCAHDLATCSTLNIAFGDGVGRDNVIQCAAYHAVRTPLPEYVIIGGVFKTPPDYENWRDPDFKQRKP